MAAHHFDEPVLAPTTVKRQHYVPQCFLRPFANEKGQVRVVDLDAAGREYRTATENAAVEGRFYDVTTKHGVLSAESWLSELEGNATPLLERLVTNPAELQAFTVDEEMVLARFLASFRFRTPTFHDEMQALDDQMVAFAKKIMRSYLRNKYPPTEAERIWKERSSKPNEWWLANAAHGAPAETAVQMLGDVQGYANLLWHMPWRVGRVPAERPLYTSDNPLASYYHPVRAWWESAAFGNLQYWVPLSPRVLLRIDRLPDPKEGESQVGVPGARLVEDFDAWKAGFALNVVSANARRYLYGDAQVVPRERAQQWLQQIDRATLDFAIKHLGHDPHPPCAPPCGGGPALSASGRFG